MMAKESDARLSTIIFDYYENRSAGAMRFCSIKEKGGFSTVGTPLDIGNFEAGAELASAEQAVMTDGNETLNHWVDKFAVNNIRDKDICQWSGADNRG